MCYVKDLQQRLLMGAAVADWLVVFFTLPSTWARGLTLRGRPAFFEDVFYAIGCYDTAERQQCRERYTHILR